MKKSQTITNKSISINLSLFFYIKIFITLVILLVILITNSSYAAINIYYRNISEIVNSKGGPEFSGEFRATNSSGEQIILNSSNTLLLENEAIINKTINFEEVNTSGWQKLRWTSALDVSGKTSCTFIVSDKDETGVRQLAEFEFDMPQLGFYRTNNTSSEPTLELVFDKTNQTQEVKQVYLRYVPALNQKIYLDSITFTSPNFSYSWAGNEIDRVPPPKWLMPYNYYLITITYDRPIDKSFQRECMIFHYGGGLKRKFEILTQTYDLPLVRSLEVDAPTGEEVLAPCQDFLIKWHGQSAKHPVEISYSINGGANWKEIATVAGNTNEYTWNVPPEVTNNAIVKVAQNFNKSENLELFTRGAAIKSATFNKNANKVITVSENGLIREWDLYNKHVPEVITEIKASSNAIYSDVKYITDDKFIILSQDNQDNNSVLLYCNTGENKIHKQIKLYENFISEKIIVDEKFRFILAAPKKYSNKIQFIDTSGKFIKNIISDFPVNDVVINKKQDNIYISSIDNTIKVFSIDSFPVFKEIKKYDFSEHWRVINKIAVSQDSRLISLAMTSPIFNNKDSQYNNNYILDNATGKLFRKLIFSQETSIGSDFSPNGNISIFANRGEEWNVDQIAFTDLTGKLDFDKTSFSDFRPGVLLGFEVAETGNSLVEYSEGEQNCYVVNFSLPETATSKKQFVIENPVLEVTNNSLDTLLIGTYNYYVFNRSICNIGRVPAVFQSVGFRNGKHIKIINYTLPDTLQVGECATFEVLVLPIDTGYIQDELIFSACGVEYSVPFNLYSKNRNLTTLISQPLNFEETCVNESISKKIVLFRNADTVPILVNGAKLLHNKNFYLKYFPVDTIIQPGEDYILELVFSPLEMGDLKDTVLIYHSNQTAVTPFYYVEGAGIGTYLATSHKYLYFVPEIKSRDISIKNTGETMLYIDSIKLAPPDLYNILTPLPLVLNAGETRVISVEFTTQQPQKAILEFIAKPCVISEILELGAYSGDVLLTLPDINADPRDTNVKIPIMFQMSENVAYQGARDFYAKISVNPRIFYPLEVSSKYGVATIDQNEVINNTRIISIRINGDFVETKGTLLELSGAAGLCETDKSELAFMSDAKYFGASVNTSLQNSTFKLINLCGDRRILRNKLEILSLAPNPANSYINIKYKTTENIFGKISIEVFNIYGELILENFLENNIFPGEQNYKIPLSNIPAGNYYLHVNHEGIKQVFYFSVIK